MSCLPEPLEKAPAKATTPVSEAGPWGADPPKMEQGELEQVEPEDEEETMGRGKRTKKPRRN